MGSKIEENNLRGSIIVTSGLTKIYKTAGNEDFYALRDVNIEIPRGKLTILKGRSGSGKTTLINMLSALDTPTEGEVYFDGDEITQAGESERTVLRRKDMGFIFQSVALIPVMTAYENVEFGLRIAGYEGNRKKRAEECIRIVGLTDRMKHMPQELSGGEQQRIAIARALAHNPKVVFADEPTGALDTTTGLMVMKLFKDIVKQEGITMVMTTHDTGLMELGDVVYEMEDGEIV